MPPTATSKHTAIEKIVAGAWSAAAPPLYVPTIAVDDGAPDDQPAQVDDVVVIAAGVVALPEFHAPHELVLDP